MIAKTFAAVAIATFAAVAPASAQSFEFRYQSYELQTKGGRDALMVRLENFVERVCDANGSRGIAVQRAAAECAVAVKGDIMSKIDNVDFASLSR